MTRERISRALLRAYPAHTRASLGAEMVGTVLDSTDASRLMFARECVDLVIAGMRARAGANASEKIFRQLVDAFVLAGQICLGILVSHGTAQFVRDPAQGIAGGLLFVLAVWPILGLSLIGARRAAGAAGATWFVCLMLIIGHRGPNVAVGLLVPFTTCLAMAAGQPSARRDPRRLAWLAPVVLLSVLPPSQMLLSRFELDALILGSALALAIFPINPRLLVACALVWTTISLMSATLFHGAQTVPLLFALSAPIVLLATTGRVVLVRGRRARL